MKSKIIKYKPRFFVIIFIIFFVFTVFIFISQKSKKSLITASSNSSNENSIVISENKSSTASEATTSTQSEVKVYRPLKTTLIVNADNPIPYDYKPNLVPIDSKFSIDSTAYIALMDMMKSAKKDNITLTIISAYRSISHQEMVFSNKVDEYKKKGQSDDEAYASASKYVAIPGTSEHSLGLAIDFNSLYESFENTKEFNWLYKNCAKYGFILRYPKDKTHITKINYEPWHYRYVGSTIAKQIMDKKITLEEYFH